MKARICEATGKRIFKRHQDAHKAIGSTAKRVVGLVRKPQSTYQCIACGKWHLTGMPPQEARQLRRRA